MTKQRLPELYRNVAACTARFTSSCATGTEASSAQSKNHANFRYSDLEIIKATSSQMKPKPGKGVALKFGLFFSDHMFEVDYSAANGWTKPIISPMHDLKLHPAAKVLHYAIELFEGMKAYKGVDNKIRLFRPELNMARMKRSAARATLPDFSASELTKIIAELVKLDRDWVPESSTASLYLRPTYIGTDATLGVGHSNTAKLFIITGPAGAYYPTGFQPVSLLADPRYVRAFPGGVGQYKMGCNYAPSLMVGRMAQQKGCQQVLWLYGDTEDITEVGTMNVFIFWKNKNGQEELVTAPLENGLILPGVTRDSLLTLARKWNQFKVSERYVGMHEVIEAIKEKRIYEMFGSGTACVVSPVGRILYKGKNSNDYEELLIPTINHKPNLMQKLYETIVDIQYGKIEEVPGWTKVVC